MIVVLAFQSSLKAFAFTVLVQSTVRGATYTVERKPGSLPSRVYLIVAPGVALAMPTSWAVV